jgi:hypothetical protein
MGMTSDTIVAERFLGTLSCWSFLYRRIWIVTIDDDDSKVMQWCCRSLIGGPDDLTRRTKRSFAKAKLQK